MISNITVPILIGSDNELTYSDKINKEIERFNKQITSHNIFCELFIVDSKNLLTIIESHKSDNSIFCYVVIEKSNHISHSITTYTNKLIISSNTSEKTVIGNIKLPYKVLPSVICEVILKVACIKYPKLSNIVNEHRKRNHEKQRISYIVQKYNTMDNVEEMRDKIDEDNYQFVRAGKVRNLFKTADDNTLMMSATNRLSAFDRNICEIPFKGCVLNNISLWWFENTKDIVPNHVICKVNSNDILVRKCTPFPIEFVMRGYMTGSSKTSIWGNYNKGIRNYCGHKLSDGMVKNQQLERNILTPTSKGKTDELTSEKEIIEKNIMTQSQWDTCSTYTYQLFEYGQKVAKENGLILVDTKYEFGYDSNGNIMLIDEIHTPDSSRYWFEHSYLERFLSNLEPEMIDKEIIRKWIKNNYDPYDKTINIEVSKEMQELVMKRYIQLYEIITRQPLEMC